MSVLPSLVNLTYGDRVDIINSGNVNFLSSINVPNGTINTSQINLDDVQMDCAVLGGVPSLLLNGVPVASVSSFTSSITQWSAYPALSTISYNAGAGTGGIINMAFVNSLSNVSTASLTAGTGIFNGSLSTIGGATISGFPYPMSMGAWNKIALPNPPSTVLDLQNGQVVPVDFSGQANGLYVIIVDIQSGGVDPWTCQFFVTKGTSATVVTSGTHFPSFNPYGSPISLANCITAQCQSVGSATADIIFFSNATPPNGLIGSTAQLSVYRIY
jgi:hypothetical protein